MNPRLLLIDEPSIGLEPRYIDMVFEILDDLQRREGKTSVLRAGPKFELLAQNSLDGRVLASPAAVGRALFLRTDSHLYRIEERSK